MSGFVPTYLGGTSALSTQATVGSPEVERDNVLLPGTEGLSEGEIRVSILGSGLPWVTKAQAAVASCRVNYAAANTTFEAAKSQAAAVKEFGAIV